MKFLIIALYGFSAIGLLASIAWYFLIQQYACGMGGTGTRCPIHWPWEIRNLENFVFLLAPFLFFVGLTLLTRFIQILTGP